MIRDIQDEIIRLKKEKDFCIIAHSYMTPDVLEIADFTGDSYKLSLDAVKVENKNILMCGVRFMAETAKILSPEKNVYLSNPDAGCPMAEQFSVNDILSWKKENPDYTVVAYINTTAELKTVCDVCVTSSSAEKIVSSIDNDKILFLPDRNLGSFVAGKVPNKTIKTFSGGCPIHSKISVSDVENARKKHPKALLLVHPECPPDVAAMADYVGSTSGIMDFAVKSDSKEFIIGTEISILQTLQIKYPEKSFFPLSKSLICPDMKSTSLTDILNILKGNGGEIIEIDEAARSKAYSCIDNMVKMGG